jgi:transposase
MINVRIDSNDIKIIKNDRFGHPHPRVRLRMEVLWLKYHDLPHGQIAVLSGISSDTVTNYLRLYKEGGIEKIRETNFHKPQSDLVRHTSVIRDYFTEHPPASIREAMGKIEELTGLKRSEPQIRKFLGSIGFRHRKVGMIPAKADAEKQEKFKNEELMPRLGEAKKGERKVFFVDAAHFVLAPFLGYLRSLTRIFVKAPTGRQRFNVLGALDSVTHELIMVTNDTYVNALSVCELLYRISESYAGIPITLVLDNARCQIVYELANLLEIELLYLPAYSPNLNLIERLWKFVKKECLYSKYYPNFELFRSVISECPNSTHTTQKSP